MQVSIEMSCSLVIRAPSLLFKDLPNHSTTSSSGTMLVEEFMSCMDATLSCMTQCRLVNELESIPMRENPV